MLRCEMQRNGSNRRWLLSVDSRLEMWLSCGQGVCNKNTDYFLNCMCALRVFGELNRANSTSPAPWGPPPRLIDLCTTTRPLARLSDHMSVARAGIPPTKQTGYQLEHQRNVELKNS